MPDQTDEEIMIQIFSDYAWHGIPDLYGATEVVNDGELMKPARFYDAVERLYRRHVLDIREHPDNPSRAQLRMKTTEELKGLSHGPAA